MIEIAVAVISLAVGIGISFLLPLKYKGYPILSVAIVYCRRTNGLKWLAWHVFGKDKWATWYEDTVERDVFGP